ncbi:hypothetical protein [Methanobacterium sp. BAmetb5]|uniref:hypothetical protein n=1 Tax=Methanobacterium sp. BAmetb5 TaxID=2025351 RepID=UPI0025F964F7|nr:hypothetical protein [Methanobacterium sp. BAmetb5]
MGSIWSLVSQFILQGEWFARHRIGWIRSPFQVEVTGGLTSRLNETVWLSVVALTEPELVAVGVKIVFTTPLTVDKLAGFKLPISLWKLTGVPSGI